MAEQGVHAEQGVRATLRDSERTRVGRNRLLGLSALALASLVGAVSVLRGHSAQEKVPALATANMSAMPAVIPSAHGASRQKAQPVAQAAKRAPKSGQKSGQNPIRSVTPNVLLGPEILPYDDGNAQSEARAARRRRRRHREAQAEVTQSPPKDAPKALKSEEQTGNKPPKTAEEPARKTETRPAEDTNKPPDDDPNKP